MLKEFDLIQDPLIREGVAQAVEKTLMPALVQRVYSGHFTVTADGSHFGSDITWPGLDSWEMAGAYLLLGLPDVVLNYFAFVRGAQRADGNIPFAILPAEPKPDTTTYLRGLHDPQDIYQYTSRDGTTRRWIGLFDHWQLNANPLSVLAPICYILTADEIARSTRDLDWLRDNLPSIEQAARYLLSRISPNGLMSGAGFYIELPPRNQWDGVTQCYAIDAFRKLASMCDLAGASRLPWSDHAEQLRVRFDELFWRTDHFAEYVHPDKGVVDRRLSDVNFAAIGLNIASDEQTQILWPKLSSDRAFWWGGMPTQLVAPPVHYEPWELNEPLPFELANGPLYDVAAMGRVWFLDACTCARVGDWNRLRESVRLVCEMGKRHDWKWHERYHAQPDGTAHPKGPPGYCEYPAILVRIVSNHAHAFANDPPL